MTSRFRYAQLALTLLSFVLLALLGSACTPPPEQLAKAAPPEEEQPSGPAAEWALAIHGGAGAPDRDIPAAERYAYVEALRAALTHGKTRLAEGASALDVVEEVVRMLEDTPVFNAGKGAVFNSEGKNELDASIMDGRTLACGGVAGVRTVKNPVTLARLVMTDTDHVLLMGDGAEAFADEMGVERVNPRYYFTEYRWQQFQDRLAEQKAEAEAAEAAALEASALEAAEDEAAAAEEAAPEEEVGGSTVGAVARDVNGNLAAATSTGGLTAKKWGRVGDTPIVGAGTYADNRTVAVSGTGTGEEFIRHGVAQTVSKLMAYQGLDVGEAAGRVVHGILQPDDGGVIAVARDGSIALVFNTPGMHRGAADSNGRFEVAIWDEAYPGEIGAPIGSASESDADAGDGSEGSDDESQGAQEEGQADGQDAGQAQGQDDGQDEG